jgi:ATP-dependent Lon protease
MDVVVFPHMIIPLLVLDERIITGIHSALETNRKQVVLLASRSHEENQPIGTKDLFSVGTLATIMRLIKMPDSGVKILVQGQERVQVQHLVAENQMLMASIQPHPLAPTTQAQELDGHIRAIKAVAEKIAATGSSLSPDFHVILGKMSDSEKIAEFVLSHLNLTVEQAQELLEKDDQVALLAGIYSYLAQEIEVAEVQERIKNGARKSMNNMQKEFYLREQLKAIRKELGEEDEDHDKLAEKLAQAPLTEEARAEGLRQLKRLEKTPADSMEASVIRTYLDWLLELPWGKHSAENLDIKKARTVLDEDHYGLHEIKERILDFISVRTLKHDGHAPILCFAGPPGTGKTSLGKSIARSLGREYIRVALGGIKDEAEIRGHRRTYVGAMPGRFIQALRKAESCNPVIVIDEIDKLGQDFRGDPSAAMLEVLDPHQNKAFHDNYLGVAFDLSKAIFIATANSLENLAEPLRDRLEVISLSGYTPEEKLEIAKRHLVRKAVHDAGLAADKYAINDEVLADIVANYTREAGVRDLERCIRRLFSKAARAFVEEERIVEISNQSLESLLGPRRYMVDEHDFAHHVGVTNGLAWTPYGGDILKIEAVVMPGKGRLILTGQLGNVMKESAQAAMSYARAHAPEFGIPTRMFTHYDLHIHVPAGSIPKDGPSAGITMLSSILSALTQRPINADYAMTGELDLQGNVMPIGGLKEKLLAAKRNRVQHVILPRKNRHEMTALADLMKDLDVIWVDHARQVLHHVLMQQAAENA